MSGNVTRSSRVVQSAKFIYYLAIASLVPILRPRLFLNTTIFDYVNGTFIVLFVIYLLSSRKLRLRLLIPLLIMFCGSFISMLDAQVPQINLLALSQDLYLFISFIVLYNVIENKQDSGTIILLWVIFAAAQGGLMLSELAGNFSARAMGTFLNPNMSGDYFGVSFFLLFQPYIRLNWMLKPLLGILILGGLFATKSLSVMVGFLIGSLAVIALYWGHVRIATKARLGLAVLTIAIVAIGFYPELERVPNLLNRAPGSVQERVTLWQTGVNVFGANPLGIGIGPGGFSIVGPIVGGVFQRKSELHSDWLSFLVERGVIGFIGLLLLFGTIAAMLFRSLKAAQSDREFLWVAGLCGMFVFILIDALFHEVLHYRHVWFAFAAIAAQYDLRRRLSGESSPLANKRMGDDHG